MGADNFSVKKAPRQQKRLSQAIGVEGFDHCGLARSVSELAKTLQKQIGLVNSTSNYCVITYAAYADHSGDQDYQHLSETGRVFQATARPTLPPFLTATDLGIKTSQHPSDAGAR